MIATDPRPPAAIKIDVEGFEIYVLKGLLETLRTHKPFVVTEVVAQHLNRAGMTCQDVFDLMAEIGYKGYNYEPKRTGLNFKLEIVPASPLVEAQNVLWVPNESPVRDRLRLG